MLGSLRVPAVLGPQLQDAYHGRIHFRALDDTTGEVLWETNIGAPVSGYPVSFAVDGKQYVAITTGQSLVAGAARRVTPELTGESPPPQVVVFALP